MLVTVPPKVIGPVMKAPLVGETDMLTVLAAVRVEVASMVKPPVPGSRFASVPAAVTPVTSLAVAAKLPFMFRSTPAQREMVRPACKARLPLPALELAFTSAANEMSLFAWRVTFAPFKAVTRFAALMFAVAAGLSVN